MAQGLVYQPPKWEKELSNKAKVWKKQDGKISAYYNIMALLTRNAQKDRAQRNYCGIYSNLHLQYHIIAGNLYLKNPNDIQCVTYCYLSGLAGIFAYLFDNAVGEKISKQQQNLDITEMENTVKDFAFSILQLYAVNQPIPPYIKNINHLYISLFEGDFEKTRSLLSETETEFDLSNPNKLWISEIERSIIQAIISKDDNALYKSLIQHIKKYRKWPVGYSTFIDICSIAYIKLAHQYGMNCELNIIEIPKMFFDDTVCRIDVTEIKLPFYEDAVEQLKTFGIEGITLL